MTKAIIVTVESVRTRASTSEALLTLAVPLEQAALIAGFMSKIHQPVGVAFADVGGKPNPSEQRNGFYAAALHKHGFFLNPHVLAALGSDEEYRQFVRLQPCCAPRTTSCGGDVVAAHVRRIADGAGTGIKPEFSAVPLCDSHHRLQHQQGESAVELRGKKFFDKKRAEMCNAYGHDRLREALGVEALSDATPLQIVEWAESVGVFKYLPGAFKG